MKISEITVNDVCNYLRLDTESLVPGDLTLIGSLIKVSVNFIKSHTGHSDKTVKGEEVGIGDGVKTAFHLAYKCVVKDTLKVYVDSAITECTVNYDKGEITFASAPSDKSVITADYQAVPSDAYEDFIIVVYILCQDMYDNRQLYVDKNNLNKVVDTILGMHTVNLL